MLYVDCNTAKGKRMASKKLREALDEKSARTRKVRKILLFLPDLTEHRGHDISKVNQFIVNQPICNILLTLDKEIKDLNDRFLRLASLWLANIHFKNISVKAFYTTVTIQKF